MAPVIKLPTEKFDEFKAMLEKDGFTFEVRPYQIFLARKGAVVVNLYESGKIVFGGADKQGIERVSAQLQVMGSEEVVKQEKVLPPLEVPGNHIGTDEVGKGDYFGPLVVAGVLVTADTEKALKNLGVRDSKTLSDTTIRNLAIKIRKIVGRNNYEEVWITPLKYNIMYQRNRNVNRILGWGHARVIENILTDGDPCEKAVADQFGDESFIQDALMRRGSKIDLLQTPKAERDTAVAAASILARDIFLREFEEMCRSYQTKFPRGSTHVIDAGKEFVESYGVGALQNVAKLHFSTTQKVTQGTALPVSEEVTSQADVDSLPRPQTERTAKDARLEIFSLIGHMEGEVRQFLEKKLKEHFGADWWTKGVDENIRKKCEGLRDQEVKKGRKVQLIDCLDFAHYSIIMTRGENWEKIFAPVFRSKEKVLARLTILKDWRDPAYHVRGQLGDKEKAEVMGAVHWLRKMMTQQTSLTEFASGDVEE
jgi:ribonuclease HIII